MSAFGGKADMEMTTSTSLNQAVYRALKYRIACLRLAA
jgi:hypothetical protein